MSKQENNQGKKIKKETYLLKYIYYNRFCEFHVATWCEKYLEVAYSHVQLYSMLSIREANFTCINIFSANYSKVDRVSPQRALPRAVNLESDHQV